MIKAISRYTRWALVVFCVLSTTFLASCASPTAQAGTPIVPAIPSTAIIEIQANPTAAQAAPAANQTPQLCSQIPLPNSVLVLDTSGSHALISPIDPANGSIVCGYQALQFNNLINYAYSSDYTRLAVIAYSGMDFHDGVLNILNLKTWQITTTTIKSLQNTNAIAFNPAGTQLAISEDMTSTGPNQAPAYRLDIVDLEQPKILAQKQLAYAPQAIKYTADGSALGIFGATNQAPAGTQPQAYAQWLRPADLSILWEASLPGVYAGSTLPKTASSDPIFDMWSPGIAFSVDGSLLYIDHSDANVLTKVDFSHQMQTNQDIQPRLSWLDQLFRLTAGVAYAKGMNGTTKQAVLSPDGKHLYVLGMTNQASLDKNGNPQFSQTPLGLQVIDPQSGAELAKFDTQASSDYLSPDGTLLFLNTWQDPSAADVVDASSLKVIKHFDQGSLVVAYSSNGRASNLLQTDRGELMALLDPQTFTPTRSAWQVHGYPLIPMP